MQVGQVEQDGVALVLPPLISRQPIEGQLKGIVSRDFEWLQMILMNRTWVPGVPLDV